MTKVILGLAIFLLFFVGTAWSWAEEDSIGNDLPVYYLGEVVVIGEKPSEPPTAVIEVTAKQIEYQGAKTVGEVLSLVPGVVVSTGYKNSTEIKIRGFVSRNTLILLDGRPVNLPYYGDLDLSSLPLSNVSKIKIIKGPISSVYGANTIGGVVNIISKRANLKPTREFSLSFGKNKTWDTNLNYGQPIGKFDFWVSFGKGGSDGYELSEDFKPTFIEDGGLRDNSDYQRFNLDGKLNYRYSPETDFSLSLGYYDAEKGLPSGTDLPKYWRFDEWKRYYFDLSGEKYFGSKYYLKVKFYSDICRNRLIDYQDKDFSYSNINYDSFHDSWDFGSSISSKIKFKENLESSFGVNLREDGIKKKPDVDMEEETYKTSTFSFFNQHQVIPFSFLSLDLGASFNLFSPEEGLEKTTNSFDPYFGFGFEPLRFLRFHLSISRNTRFPTLHQLYAEVSGNKDLKSEKALKLEIGTQIEFLSSFSVGLDFFRNNVKDLIDRPSREYQYRNIDRVILQGIEVNFEGKLKKNLSFSIDYTYLDAYNKNTGYWLPYSPNHKIDYRVSYTTEFGLGIHSTGQYVGKRVMPHPEDFMMTDYFIANMKVSQRVHQYFEVFSELKNIFDKNYEDEEGFPMPGRTFLAGFKINI